MRPAEIVNIDLRQIMLMRNLNGKESTGPSPEACECGWDSNFDEFGMGASVLAVYSASICLVEYGVVAHLLGLSFRGGSKRVAVLATTATSQI